MCLFACVVVVACVVVLCCWCFLYNKVANSQQASLASRGAGAIADRVAKGRKSAGSKMIGQSVEDALAPHGWHDVTKRLAAVCVTLSQDAFDSCLIGGKLENFSQACINTKKEVAACGRLGVILANKVSKWKDVPEGITDELKTFRSKVTMRLCVYVYGMPCHGMLCHAMPWHVCMCM